MTTPALRMATLFGQTLRDAPADADSEGHRLLLRAAFIRRLSAGIYTAMPLGWRSLQRVMTIIREEMDGIGGQELAMPVVHPAELWRRTGRYDAIDVMVHFQDRAGREMVLGPTHEEVVSELASTEIASWRQLPQLVYQIQTKFRDEARPRAGLIRVREFLMKDSYSFDRDLEGLQRVYDAHHVAYMRIFERCGLGAVVSVKSDTGMMGGLLAHEFIYPTPIGEDTLVRCRDCGAAANQQVARFVKRREDGGDPAELDRVATPGMTTIEALASFLDVSRTQTAKAVFFMGLLGQGEKLVLAMVRGDHEVNETKLGNAIGATGLRAATVDEIRAVGAEPGYASPIGIDRTRLLVVVDDLVAETTNLVSGANQVDVHYRNVNANRDFGPDTVVIDIAIAFEGAGCIECDGSLELFRGVEVGNIFQLGTRYSAALGAMYTDEHGHQHPLVMGSYGIGVGRLLGCVAEEHHDDRGLTLPSSVAPLDVVIVVLGDEGREPAARLVDELERLDVRVLLDDRDVSAGIKFADADLIGAPLRVTISRRSLGAGGAELRTRSSGATCMQPVVAEPVLAALAGLRA